MPVIAGTQLLDPNKILSQVEIREGMQIADFGCGALGHFVIAASGLVGNAGKVYCVDIQKSALQAFESNMKLAGVTNAVPLWGDIERPRGVQIPDAVLDVVLLINNLFMARDKMLMGRESLRALKSGGKLIVVDWKITGAPLGPPPTQRVSQEQAKLAMQAAGFRGVHAFEAGPYHYGLVFEKP